MIDLIVRILNIDDFYGISENIDIAKGKYKLNTNFKEAWKKRKRLKYGRRY